MSAETRFEWDPAKAVSNKAKHGVSFEIATEVWLDPLRVERQDRWEAGEERWQTIGTVGGETLVLVAHTVKSEEGFELIRIISARRATRKERELYEQE